MAKRWDDSHLPGALAALAVIAAAGLPWFLWWPDAQGQGFDRFNGHVVRLILPACATILASGYLAEAMSRKSLSGKPHARPHRLASLCRAAGLLLGAGAHFSQYHPNLWVVLGWVAGAAIGFGLAGIVETRGSQARP